MTLSESLLLRRLIKRINSSVDNFGLQATISEIVRKTGTKLIIEGKNKKTISALKKGTVIVVANHPSEADVAVLLAALENRPDNNLIINSSFTKIFSSIDKHLIPVYINSRILGNKSANLRLKFFKKIHSIENLSSEEEHKRNIVNIDEAINRLNKNQLVAIFPGGGGENGKWFSGVGYLIKGIKDIDKTYFVNAYIEGTSVWDALRFIPGFSKILPKFKINFDDPKRLNHVQDLGAKEIAAVLEREYYQWVGATTKKDLKISIWQRMIFNQKGYLFLRSLFLWLVTKPN